MKSRSRFWGSGYFWGALPLCLYNLSSSYPLIWHLRIIFRGGKANSRLRARFHGRLELDMRVQPALQHALLKYRLCRDWRDWRPNWISFSTQPIACLHGNKVTAFLFYLPFCPRFPPVQASHGNAL
jgi:hypothetical protein